MDTETHVEIRSLPFTLPQLRGLIRQKLMNGSLPEDLAHHAYGGISQGGRCAACDRAIERGKTVIGTYGLGGSSRSYHPQCHLMLSTELEELAQN